VLIDQAAYMFNLQLLKILTSNRERRAIRSNLLVKVNKCEIQICRYGLYMGLSEIPLNKPYSPE